MGRILLVIMFSLFLKTGCICLGDPIDPIINEIFEKLSENNIVETFKTDKDLLFTLLNNTKPLYEKLIEKPDSGSKITKIFSILCDLMIPDFKSFFPDDQMLYLTKDQLWDCWVEIMMQTIDYYQDLIQTTDCYWSSENSESEKVWASEDFEEDYF